MFGSWGALRIILTYDRLTREKKYIYIYAWAFIQKSDSGGG